MHGCSTVSCTHSRMEWTCAWPSRLLQLRAICPYLASSPTRSSLIFAFLVNIYSFLSPARSSLIFAFLMNSYSFLIFAFLMKRTSGLRSFGLLWDGPWLFLPNPASGRLFI